ncbi:tungstate transport system substrate-binding protein [Methylomarinovum caldicuralii]|uniref:Tungstate transport system substrate-binding protein n=1 Tax=Methylomarinovum caldicuralii TaxID=438856 RepID=A0AAU9C257_9GAMM|nr:substrate-binding domain-containing protein [Methylomarinovum caldicuralii]BCX82457.1 tungstate transport system substrate-binding protein [Methylomarinovum caldicuralii]
MKTKLHFLLLLLLLAPALPAGERLRLATTTSTDNTGLLAAINAVFTERTGIAVDVIAVGTGKALKLGRNCDVDAVLVHAPEAEKAFVEAGYGIDRLAVMHNDFVIVGPKGDPAGVRRAKTAAEALGKIARAQVPFVSRGDDSGTHKKEKQLWRQAGIEPQGAWYYSIGQGMGAALQVAEEKQAYVLTDRGTWLAMQDKLPDLTVVFEGDPALFNPYHLIAVNPKRCPNADFETAMQYAAFLTGPVGQKLIANFKVGGRPLFHPDVLP